MTGERSTEVDWAHEAQIWGAVSLELAQSFTPSPIHDEEDR